MTHYHDRLAAGEFISSKEAKPVSKRTRKETPSEPEPEPTPEPAPEPDDPGEPDE